ncbi:hypothetical protein M5X00_13500 [Paenibacillus alvei]|uniref:hypothetical protein n=1 Tax=Paenibacillus alvei TaxID=44250 RepID=UPI000289779D|nr:hypothetical protein [Paenibacillus alvei]EJW13852.1 hypothetical protein PAV_109p00820 [Paenibacillus alvei DSM 29]MCY9545195.1 hypothetical protein [Paenibacillus alvei]MCY9708335.1 hypothetical protein [Paenibacillus alvei]MCY9732977.1 hypothetical protein [Paenibacillus alvei]MCY9755257.1 hypothetical protein [Paenibacillus alvei]
MKTLSEEIKGILECYVIQNSEQMLTEKRNESFRKTRENINDIISEKLYAWLCANEESLKRNSISVSRNEQYVILLINDFTIEISFSGSSNDKHQGPDATYEGFVKWSFEPPKSVKKARTGGTAYTYKGLHVDLDYSHDKSYLERQIKQKFTHEQFKEILLTSLRNSLLK